jgi:hypothetical protein
MVLNNGSERIWKVGRHDLFKEILQISPGGIAEDKETL